MTKRLQGILLSIGSVVAEGTLAFSGVGGSLDSTSPWFFVAVIALGLFLLFGLLMAIFPGDVPRAQKTTRTFGRGASGNRIGSLHSEADQVFGEKAKGNWVRDLWHRPNR